jgi:serine/threonine protein kinase
MNRETSINSEIGKQNNNQTTINQLAIAAIALSIGSNIGSKYKVLSKLDVSAGEADLYLCNYNGSDYVAKVYRRKVAIKPEVTNALTKISTPFISRIYETGEINGMPYEIIPYYKYGSIEGRIFRLDDLRSRIIPSLNEGLHILHENGIIHKDLKPSNIMLSDNGKDVAIIDFGISSIKDDGSTILVTKTGMTPEYSAPETFRNLYCVESDYYSLGITVFELFCGYTPFKNMDEEAIDQYISVQRIPIPKEVPQDLSDLVLALTYYDITNRKNKANPNRRWTYEEVKRWCKGEKLVLPGEGVGISRTQMPEYTFLGKPYNTMQSLTEALAANWAEGKKQLYRGLLSGFFKSCNPEIAGFCLDAEDEASKGGDDDVIFFKLLYRLDPKTIAFFWKGKSYQGLTPLGRSLLEQLWNGEKSNLSFFDDVCSKRLLSIYVTQVDPKNASLLEAAKSLEDGFSLECKTERGKICHLYIMAYMLSGQKLFRTDGHDFRTVNELADFIKQLLDESYEKFEDFCHRMVDYHDNLNEQLEAWLIALGKRKELDQWRASLAE